MSGWEPPPCVWPLDVVRCPDWPASVGKWTVRHTLAVEIATDVLWRRTGRRYGLRPELRSDDSETPGALEIHGPVFAVVEVRAGGRLLSREDYRLRSRPGSTEAMEVAPRPGPAWPGGEVSVLYLRGRAIPLSGQRALGALASEIFRLSVNGSSPRLSIVREDVSYDMFFPAQWRERGETGLADVDVFLRSAEV